MSGKLSFFHPKSRHEGKPTQRPPIPQSSTPPPPPIHQVTSSKNNQKELKLLELLQQPVINLHRIREITWNGIPTRFRAEVWKLYLDYLPVNAAIRQATLNHKRQDYFDFVDRIFVESQRFLWTSAQKEIDSQIMRDLPRVKHPLLRQLRVQQTFERILFVWAVRHPASGYVQGMNDVLHPFFLAFLAPYIWGLSEDSNFTNNIPNDLEAKINSEMTPADLEKITDEQLKIIEADCFWCYSKLLDGLQDVYTRDQPGLYRMLRSLSTVIDRVDPPLSSWISNEDIDYQEFAFRWINCLLVREFSMDLVFRLWDNYLSNILKISSMHVYTCAAFLEILSPKIIGQPHADFIITIQSILPDSWNLTDMEEIIAQAYVYDKMFTSSPSHLKSSSVPVLYSK